MAKSAYQQKIEQEERDARKARERGDMHQAGGGSGFAEYFATENRMKSVTRGELLGMFEMVEYARRSNTWWRRLGRWFTRTPGMPNVPTQMARAHWRHTIQPALEKVQAELARRSKAANDAAVEE